MTSRLHFLQSLTANTVTKIPRDGRGPKRVGIWIWTSNEFKAGALGWQGFLLMDNMEITGLSEGGLCATAVCWLTLVALRAEDPVTVFLTKQDLLR